MGEIKSHYHAFTQSYKEMDECNFMLSQFDNKVKGLKTVFKESGSISESFLEGAIYLMVFSDDKKNVLKFLQASLEGFVLTFKLAGHKESVFTQMIFGEYITFNGTQKTSYIGHSTWIKALFIALILRDRTSIDYLCSVQEDVFKAADEKGYTSFDLHFVKILKGLFDPKASMFDLLQKGIELSHPDIIAKENKEKRTYINHIAYPLLPLIRCLLSNNEKDYNDSLVQAIQLHREFWAAVDNSRHYEGWISIPLLGICSLIQDHKKFELQVLSEYIPEWLIMNGNK